MVLAGEKEVLTNRVQRPRIFRRSGEAALAVRSFLACRLIRASSSFGNNFAQACRHFKSRCLSIFSAAPEGSGGFLLQAARSLWGRTPNAHRICLRGRPGRLDTSRSIIWRSDIDGQSLGWSGGRNVDAVSPRSGPLSKVGLGDLAYPCSLLLSSGDSWKWWLAPSEICRFGASISIRRPIFMPWKSA